MLVLTKVAQRQNRVIDEDSYQRRRKVQLLRQISLKFVKVLVDLSINVMCMFQVACRLPISHRPPYRAHDNCLSAARDPRSMVQPNGVIIDFLA